MENTIKTPEQKAMLAAAPKKKQRDSNLELYRIIVMLLIVAHHYVVNSGLTAPMYAQPYSWQSTFLFLFSAWGKTGINCFMLITGYFMCKSQITVSKYVKLLFQIELYRIVIFLIFLFTGYEPFSVTTLLKALWPFFSVNDGFVSCFLIFYLTIPFLNILIRNISEKMHICAILLGLFIYTFIGTVPFFSVEMNYVSWFIVLYFIASYFRLYPQKIFDKCGFWGLMTLLSVTVSAASVLFFVWYGAKTGQHRAYYMLSDSNKLLAVTTAVTSFLFFKNMKIKYSRIINAFGASTFGVLLIHSNSATMRRWLWKDTLGNAEMFDSKYLVLHAVVSVLAIFIICNFIDQLRILLIEKPLFRLFEKKNK